MSDPAPIDVVRSRYPMAPDEDQAELQDYAEHLGHLRRALRTEALRGTGMAVTFDPRKTESDG